MLFRVLWYSMIVRLRGWGDVFLMRLVEMVLVI